MLIVLAALTTSVQADIVPPQTRGGANLSPWDTGAAGPGDAPEVALQRLIIEAELTPLTASVLGRYTLRSDVDLEARLFGLPAVRLSTRLLPQQDLEIRVDGIAVTPRYVESWICVPNHYSDADFEPYLLREVDAPCGEVTPPDPDADPDSLDLLGLFSSHTGRTYPNHWWVFPVDLTAGQSVEVEVRYDQVDTEIYWNRDSFEALFFIHLWSGSWSGETIGSVQVDLTLTGLEDATILNTSDDPEHLGEGALRWRFEELLWQAPQYDTQARMALLKQAREEGGEQAMAAVRASIAERSRDSRRPIQLRLSVPGFAPLDQPHAPYLDPGIARLIRMQDYAVRFFASPEPPAPEQWTILITSLRAEADGDGEPAAWARGALADLQGWVEDAAPPGPERDRAVEWLKKGTGDARARALSSSHHFPPDIHIVAGLIQASERLHTMRIVARGGGVALIGIGAFCWWRWGRG